MSLLLVTGEQTIVELNSDLGVGLSYKWQQQFPAYEKETFTQLKIFLPETKSFSIKRSYELRSVLNCAMLVLKQCT